MIALDTNVLVRFVVDDGEQHERARRFVAAALARRETLYVSQIVACEFTWVLRSAYRRSKADVLSLLSQLLAVPAVRFEDDSQVRRAIERASETSLGFADCLIRQRTRDAGCATLATFDKALLEEEDTVEPL